MNTYKNMFKQKLCSTYVFGSNKNIYSFETLINLLEALDIQIKNVCFLKHFINLVFLT